MAFKSLFNKIVERVEKEAATNQKRSNLSTNAPGRMHKTDIVKGDKSSIPQEPGTYRHRNKETGEIEYVGDTSNLRKRQQEHVRSGKLDTSKQDVEYSVAKSGATREERRQTEKDHISRHNPIGNKTKGGNGR